MRCIDKRRLFVARSVLFACITTVSLFAKADAVNGQFVQSGKRYKVQLHDYASEVGSLGNSSSTSFSAPTPVIESTERTRQMPPMPKKSVQYSHLTGDAQLGSINFLRDEALVIKKPPLSALITMQRNLSPFSMDAKLLQDVALKDLLLFGLNNNLDIRIARNDAKTAKYAYRSSLGQFLPDIQLGDNQFWTRGRIGLPINAINNIRLNGPFLIANAGFTQHVYQGGKVFFGALQRKHELNASNARFHAGYSDTLSEIARRYYQLVLEEAVLQIRVRAADTSEEQVRVATERFEQGSSTNLDVLQARAQLSADRQSLLDQQVLRRQAAIDLAALMNYDMQYDLQTTGTISRTLLVSDSTNVDQLLNIALVNRAELKQLSELKKAAKAQIGVAASPLHPTVDFGGSVYGIGRNANSVDALYLLSLNMQWRLGGLGTVDAANIAAAKVQARNADVELQKKLVEVLQAVRTAFIKCRAADQNIIESDSRVSSALEELRLSEIRYQTGVGTHLDVLTAQRDYTQAQIAKVQAITNFNLSQIQLIRELGLVSVENLAASKPII